ncbi:MAG: adenine phosphoribosyltransferase [Candidatus Magasanikbacteria bacterium]|nr:adenine phosphoribosyltransferase [Candidatus Magasanikbacteria bacterium]
MNKIIKQKIRTIPNWPKQGVMYRDVTTLFKDRIGFKMVIDTLFDRYRESSIDSVVGIESRGFIVGSAIAERLGVGFVPIRKSGKLPAETIGEEYELEYGRDKIEIHKDAISEKDTVLLVDDLIATGGTALAACSLLERLKAQISECVFIVDLPTLGGSKKLSDKGFGVFSLVSFDGE